MQLVTVEEVRPRPEYYRQLEEGNVLFCPRTPFEISVEQREVFFNASQTGGARHKNIAYRPGKDQVTGFDRSSVRDVDQLRAALCSYSERALQFLRDLLPKYMDRCHIDFASFRPLEEEGRALPINKRNDLLHVDSFPSRPTGGDLILRLFTNINPAKSRVWLVSDPFTRVAREHAAAAGLSKIADAGSSPLGRLRSYTAPLLANAGFTSAKRSPYDRFMLGLHDYLKHNQDYQRNCAKYRLEFPPDSTWIVFTDIVPHAVLSGRYALEQTIIVSRESLIDRRNAPVEILQGLCERPLVQRGDP